MVITSVPLPQNEAERLNTLVSFQPEFTPLHGQFSAGANTALAEMYVQGVSTRKVKAITEELCGHSFSASAISAINKGLDEALAQFANRQLEEPYPYLIVDARYEKVREGGVIRSQAVLVAIGITGKVSARFWRWRWPTARARAVGKSFCCASSSGGCRGSSSSSRTTTRD